MSIHGIEPDTRLKEDETAYLAYILRLEDPSEFDDGDEIWKTETVKKLLKAILIYQMRKARSNAAPDGAHITDEWIEQKAEKVLEGFLNG